MRRIYLVTWRTPAADTSTLEGLMADESPTLSSLLWVDDGGISQYSLEHLPAACAITDITDRPVAGLDHASNRVAYTP